MTSENITPPNCRIFLRGIRLKCKIGIDAAELETAQQITADVKITPTADASPGRPAVDYAAVLRRLRAFAADKQHDLLEHFADEAAEIILREFAAADVRIACYKPKPFADLDAAGVEVRKTRAADGGE